MARHLRQNRELQVISPFSILSVSDFLLLELTIRVVFRRFF
jgi:hypothetical protein